MEGSLVIDRLSECQQVSLVPRNGQRIDLSQPQHINSMLYEVETLPRWLPRMTLITPFWHALTVARLQTEIRRQTGVVFPVDSDTFSGEH